MSSSAWIGSYWPWAALLMPIESWSRAARRSRIGRNASGGSTPSSTPRGPSGIGMNAMTTRGRRDGRGRRLRSRRARDRDASSPRRARDERGHARRVRVRAGIATILTAGGTSPRKRRSASAREHAAMADRHFVKYTFLKVDPAWRRLGEERTAQARVPRGLRGLRDGHLFRPSRSSASAATPT